MKKQEENVVTIPTLGTTPTLGCTVKMQALGRVAIPDAIREALELKQGDTIALTVNKIRSADSK